jgi:hypothetical protein
MRQKKKKKKKKFEQTGLPHYASILFTLSKEHIRIYYFTKIYADLKTPLFRITFIK